jgi:hypothetical protein
MTTVDTSYGTPYGIISDAMRDTGKLRQGQDPDSETLAEYMRRLNKLVNFYQTQGLKLWLIQDLPVTLTAYQALYSFGPTGTTVMAKPLRVLDGSYYLDIYGTQRPLIPMAYNDYKMLSQVSSPGALNSYMVDKQIPNLNVYFWNTPDPFAASNGQAHLIIENQITNFIQITDNMQFPIEWSLLLEWGLADQTCTGQPSSVIARCAMMEMKYREALEGWDVEDASTSFSPDQRANQWSGSFR